MHALGPLGNERVCYRQPIELVPDADYPRQQSVPLVHALAVVQQPRSGAALEARIELQLGTPKATVGADKPWTGTA